ncbi:Vta1 like-domain-containing protein [Trametes meyenii]|nr:Vta1 like-domain-containing protein [Trametes meyenii]
MVLALPPVPQELKAIAPFIQRADELSTKDPVISYWSAYYAAQEGIALRAKDANSRGFLLKLLSQLEDMKKTLGANDAVHDEPAAAAYLENFALRVFAGADAEDRKGNATRYVPPPHLCLSIKDSSPPPTRSNTAKKFVAAANFLELLHTFEGDARAVVDIPSIDEKIKYAKWKAADIARAFREGRKPTPGPAGSEATSSPALNDVGLPDASALPPATPPSGSPPRASSSSPPGIRRATPPPPPLATSNEPSAHLGAGPHLPDGLAPPQPPQSPGSWSTVATPGSPNFGLDDASSSTTTPAGSAKRRAFVSDELEGKTDDEIDAESSSPASGGKSVRFTPSVVGGLSPLDGVPAEGWPTEDPFSVRVVVNSPSPPKSPSATLPQASSKSNSPSTVPPPLPRQPAVPPARQSPPGGHRSPALYQDPAIATVTTTPPELTPQVVTRVQKHCRYAISALDYEDAEQAIKELRAALRMLGG